LLKQEGSANATAPKGSTEGVVDYAGKYSPEEALALFPVLSTPPPLGATTRLLLQAIPYSQPRDYALTPRDIEYLLKCLSLFVRTSSL
jgi:hypothetical protein